MSSGAVIGARAPHGCALAGGNGSAPGGAFAFGVRAPLRGAQGALGLAFLAGLLVAGGCSARHVVGEIAGGVDGGAREGDAGDGACDPFAPGSNLSVCSASYISGQGAEPGPTVDLDDRGVVVVGGRFAEENFGVAPVPLLGGGPGAIVRLAEAGRRVLSVTRLGEAILDLEVDSRGDGLAVAADRIGVVVLDAAARVVRFQHAFAAERVAISGGLVAALAGREVTLFGPDGTPRATFAVASGAGEVAVDVAIDAATETVIVTGTTSRLQTFEAPLLDGYGFDGAQKWRSYRWTAEQVASRQVGAATRGLRVTMGRDGKLYYLGSSTGGNTVHLHDPRDLATGAPLVTIDEHSRTYNAGRARIAFFARFRPEDGVIERAQFLAARDPRDGLAIADTFPTAIAADEGGQVIVGGRQACCGRDQNRWAISGAPVTPSAGDAFVAVFSPDFESRRVWAIWGTGGASSATAVTIRAGRAAMTALQTASETAAGLLRTQAPIQSRPAGGDADGFFSVWAVPP